MVNCFEICQSWTNSGISSTEFTLEVWAPAPAAARLNTAADNNTDNERTDRIRAFSSTRSDSRRPSPEGVSKSVLSARLSGSRSRSLMLHPVTNEIRARHDGKVPGFAVNQVKQRRPVDLLQLCQTQHGT